MCIFVAGVVGFKEAVVVEVESTVDGVGGTGSRGGGSEICVAGGRGGAGRLGEMIAEQQQRESSDGGGGGGGVVVGRPTRKRSVAVLAPCNHELVSRITHQLNHTTSHQDPRHTTKR